jgi:glycosyltransferase involved in cell wall biosynthesis
MLKVLIDHHSPFALAHGGLQIQIEQTHRALGACGVEVEWLRWWDPEQRGDLIHYFGRPFPILIERAHAKGMKFVFSELLGSTGARSPLALRAQWFANRAMERLMPRMIVDRMLWESFRETDACIALTGWEAHLVEWLFGAPRERVHVIPNGVEPEFLEPITATRGEWLVTTASILPVKQIVETARAAAQAGTPYWVIGRPFSESDAYYREFLSVKEAHPKLIRYEGPVSDRRALAQIYREARGFVMFSQWETLSLSALEAAACGCPLLLSDLQWARSVFGDSVHYGERDSSTSVRAGVLRDFYTAAPALPPPPRPQSWHQVGEKLAALYASLLNSSR